MRGCIFLENRSSLWIEQKSFQTIRQLAFVAILKCYTAWTDRLAQTAVTRSDNHAAAGDPFQRDNSKRLWPSRGHDHDLMSIKRRGQFFRGFFVGESDLSFQAKLPCQPAKPFFFRSRADDREIRPPTIVVFDPSFLCHWALSCPLAKAFGVALATAEPDLATGRARPTGGHGGSGLDVFFKTGQDV